MYLPVSSPSTSILALVGLVGCVAALFLIDHWSERVPRQAAESLALGWTLRLRCLLFWATILTVGTGVVFLALFLVLSPFLTFLAVVAV